MRRGGLTYRWLMAGEPTGWEPDRHVFACALASAADLDGNALRCLGLDRTAFKRLLALYFPHAKGLADRLPADAGPGEDELEEPDLRGLMLDHRAHDGAEAEWMAAIVARRCQRPNHLWQDLGLGNRDELNALMTRHFPGLVELNGGMKWKKFFYRQLCQRENVPICKAPSCAVCTDYADCFGEETGNALLSLAG